ncbi:tetratricopeptide repeat protein [Planktothrix sp. FACHB-1355]|uniref:protein O-GlcNAc transferase n=1 Tax=Aerosakkonema funiforme FACHB-1375 TaxID=2949571 RepID=A0A926VF99_9CYAN|nr:MULTISPECIES: tetratricopeptide repeat protein [Oscillatoriales]MBD2182846.1 tetratricopeptide repeat protein [Aerosakkonema funiforme FACHB-1375]MBD3559260.1 tetratricopeptide repeat protein [Planktothrix sp. FACHB-1355]
MTCSPIKITPALTLPRQGQANRMQSQLHSEAAQNFCNIGNQLKSQQKLNEAIESYQKALEIQPNYAQVHYELGEVYLLQRKFAEAIASCKLALKLQPDEAPTYKILGNALQAQGKIEEALRAYNKALEINPEFAEAYVNKATMLSKLGQSEEAIAYYQKAIDLKPDLAAAYWNLANVFMQLGRADEAVPCWQKALKLKPELLSAETLNDLGTAVGKQGKWEEAIGYYKRAVALKPNYPLAHFNLGTALKQQGQIEEAIVHLQSTIDLKPDYAEAYNQLGNAFLEQEKFSQALLQYRKVLQLVPDSARAYFNIGSALAQQDNFEQAIVQFQKAIELQPDLAEAYYNIGMSVQRQSQQQGRLNAEKFKYAIDTLKKAIKINPDLLLSHLCMSFLIGGPANNSDFALLREAVDDYSQNCGETGQIIAAITFIATYVKSGLNEIARNKFLEIEPLIYERLSELKSEEIASIYSQVLFNVNYLREDLPANSKLANTIGEKYVEKVIKPKPEQIYNIKSKSQGSQRLRIGILSSHFVRHSVGWCSYDTIRELNDLTQNVYLYLTGDRKPDDRTKLFEQASTSLYRPKKLANGTADTKEIIEQILKDEVDVLIDLDSLSVPIQVDIIHKQPAPVCISWLGFEAPFTNANNYFLCDWHTHPAGTEKYYREQLVRLPDSFVAVSGFECKPIQREVSRKAMRLAEDQVVYLCVAPAYKMNAEMIKSQVKMLKHVPDSILIYKGHTGDREIIQAAYQKECEAIGVRFNRIKFMPLTKTEEEHRSTYKIADVLLDSYPYNGGTHNLEALSFDLPVVTRTGEQYLSRMGYSFLQALSLSSGVAKSWEEYTDWGIKLGNETDLRLSIREQIVRSKQPENLAPLWNTKKFAQDMYNIFEELVAKQR